MPRTITFPQVIRIRRFTEVFRINGTPVSLHWTVLVIAALILGGAVKYPIMNLVGLTSWLGVILLHETGHMVAARRKHCQVDSIDLYPILGLTRYQQPWSDMDECLIKWAGVIAQAIVAVPIVVIVSILGYTRFEPVNAALAIWGFFSLGVAIFNLLPFPPLDGAIAWRIVPLLLRRAFRPHKKQYNVMRSGK